MLVVFIIDKFISLIVKNFNQKIFLKRILITISSPLIKFINSLSYIPKVFLNLFSNGGSSLTVEYRPVEPKERVRFSPAALFHCSTSTHH